MIAIPGAQCYWYLARDAAEHPEMHRSHSPVHNVYGAEVEKLCSGLKKPILHSGIITQVLFTHNLSKPNYSH